MNLLLQFDIEWLSICNIYIYMDLGHIFMCVYDIVLWSF